MHSRVNLRAGAGHHEVERYNLELTASGNGKYTAPLVLHRDLRIQKLSYTPRSGEQMACGEMFVKINGEEQDISLGLVGNRHFKEDIPKDVLTLSLDSLFFRNDSLEFTVQVKGAGRITATGRYEGMTESQLNMETKLNALGQQYVKTAEDMALNTAQNGLGVLNGGASMMQMGNALMAGQMQQNQAAVATVMGGGMATVKVDPTDESPVQGTMGGGMPGGGMMGGGMMGGGMMGPGMMGPGMMGPGMMGPGMMGPGMMGPGMMCGGIMGGGMPGAGMPGAGMPGAGMPGAGMPGAGMMGGGMPGAGMMGGGMPGGGGVFGDHVNFSNKSESTTPIDFQGATGTMTTTSKTTVRGNPNLFR